MSQKKKPAAPPEPASATAHASTLRSCLPIMQRLPAYGKLAWRTSRDPSIPFRYRLPLYSLPLYYLAPTHLPISAIPVIGQLDGPVLLLLALRQALRHCPKEATISHLQRLGLTANQIEEDLATLRAVADSALGGAGKRISFAGRVVRAFTRRIARRALSD